MREKMDVVSMNVVVLKVRQEDKCGIIIGYNDKKRYKKVRSNVQQGFKRNQEVKEMKSKNTKVKLNGKQNCEEMIENKIFRDLSILEIDHSYIYYYIINKRSEFQIVVCMFGLMFQMLGVFP